MKCSVELLSVGNELLLGNTVNTNASWIATRVTAAGAHVGRVTTVPDNLEEISNTLRESLTRAPNFLITTGGIGPTFDDMTLKGVAVALGLRIGLNQDALRMIRAHYLRRFKSRRMTLTKPRLKMANLPQDGTPIPNPVGTAPGVRLVRKGTTIFCLPGVPSEAKAIFMKSILPEIRSKTGESAYVERWLKISGIMESSLAPIIDRVMESKPGVYIKSHPRGIKRNRAQIDLHFSAFAPTQGLGNRILSLAVQEMKLELRRRGVVMQT